MSRIVGCLVLVGLGFGLAPSLPASMANDDVLTPEIVANLRSVTEVAISPDGESIAHAVAVPRNPFEDGDGPPRVELHVVDREGQARPFVTGSVSVSQIDWRSDGEAISFLAKREGDEFTSLYTIPVDGGESRRVVSLKADIRGYSWSPDGLRVALLATDPVEEEVRTLREKGFTQKIYEEDWQDVRVWVALVSDVEDEAEPKALELDGSASELSWSPAGDLLAVALAPTPSVDDNFTSRKLHVIRVEDGSVVSALENEGKLGPVRWSPEGIRIAFISGEDQHDPAPGRVFVSSASDDQLVDLLPDFDGHVADLVWLDGETILAICDERAQTTLRRLSIDEPGPGELLYEGETILTAVDLAPDSGALALIGDSPRHPAEVFLLESDGDEPRRLTELNEVLDGLRFADQEVITYKASDGLELEGILIHPLDREEGRRVPLILSVHGGPEAHDRNGWQTSYSRPGQVAAARGFAVLAPNYRGSTGRGVEFSKLGQADAAGKEFDDLVDAIDHLAETGLVDPEKVGITGGSYGGYASGWGATRYSDRFAASVMFVGISDKISKSGTTDIPQEEYLVHARKRPWEDWMFFLERSPIYHAQGAKTPILILHGEDDPRVHPSQSLELYRYLKLAGEAPVRLVLYPGEGHGNRRAASRYDYHLRLLQWMEHYLKGPGGDPPPYQIDYEALKGDPDNDNDNDNDNEDEDEDDQDQDEDNT